MESWAPCAKGKELNEEEIGDVVRGSVRVCADRNMVGASSCAIGG